MAKLEKLIEDLLELDGREASTLNAIANEIADAGYMAAGSSTQGDISGTAAANLLIAMNTPYMPDRPAVSVPIFRGLKKTNDPVFGPSDHRAFRNMSLAETLGDAMEAFLQDACSIRRWFVEGKSSQDAIDYIVGYTCAMRVTFTITPFPSASIKIARDSDKEPTYWLAFDSTSETVKLMPNGVVPDRETVISVGLPTLLTFAGAVLGRDLIEEEVEDDRQRYAIS